MAHTEFTCPPGTEPLESGEWHGPPLRFWERPEIVEFMQEFRLGREKHDDDPRVKYKGPERWFCVPKSGDFWRAGFGMSPEEAVLAAIEEERKEREWDAACEKTQK